MSRDLNRPDVVVVAEPGVPVALKKLLESRGLKAVVVASRDAAWRLPVLDPLLVVVKDGPTVPPLRGALCRQGREPGLVLLASWAPSLCRAAVSSGYVAAVLDRALPEGEMARRIALLARETPNTNRSEDTRPKNGGRARYHFHTSL